MEQVCLHNMSIAFLKTYIPTSGKAHILSQFITRKPASKQCLTHHWNIIN
jgi:hypothetical protein